MPCKSHALHVKGDERKAGVGSRRGGRGAGGPLKDLSSSSVICSQGQIPKQGWFCLRIGSSAFPCPLHLTRTECCQAKAIS